MSLRGGVLVYKTADDADALNCVDKMIQAAQIFFHKMPLLQEIPGRIAGNHQFREDDQIACRGCGLVDEGPYLVHIALKIPNGGVDLGECDSHGVKTKWRILGAEVKALKKPEN